ncbi:MAG: putative porin [Saprospiraceae bacterium]
MKITLIFWCFLLIAFDHIYAQNFPGQEGFSGIEIPEGPLNTAKDSIEKPPLKVDYYQLDEMGYIQKTLQSIVQKEHSTDLLQDDLRHFGLGNIFSAITSVRFQFHGKKGNELGIDSYDLYREYVPTGILSSPNRPVVKGAYGTRFNDGHRNINLDFSRTFARNITFGFRIFSGKSDGQYNHQNSSFNALEFNILQRSKKDRRRSYIHFNILRNKESLNAGLTNPSEIINAISGGNIGYSVINNDSEVNLKNTVFRMGTTITLGRDSIPQKWIKIGFAEIGSEKERFRHIEKTIDEDDMTSYLPIIIPDFIDTINISSHNIYEKFGLRIKSENVSLSSGLQIMQNIVSQDSIFNVNRNQIFLNTRASFSINKGLKSDVSFYQEVGGLKERNLMANIQFRKFDHKLTGYLAFGSEASGVFQTSLLIGKNPVWSHQFSNQNYFNIGIKYQNVKWNTTIHIKNTTVQNYIYLNHLKLYNQTASSLNIISTEMDQKFSFGFLHINNKILLQSVNDETIISLPKISTRHDIAFSISFFKKKLKTRIGSIIWYRSNSNLPLFHAFLNDFYFDNTTLSSHYFRVSPYIKADISGLEVYVGIDDLENMIRGTRRFNVSGYPQLDSRINLAFRVRLLD